MAYQGSIAPISSATRLGQKAGDVLGDTLKALAEGKLDSLEQKHSFNEYRKAGYSNEQAHLFSMHRKNPNILKLIQSSVPGMQEEGMPEQPQFSSPSQQILQIAQGQQPSPQEQQQLRQYLSPQNISRVRSNQNLEQYQQQPQSQEDMLQRFQQAGPYEMGQLMNQQNRPQPYRQPIEQDQLRNLLEKGLQYQQQQAQPQQQPPAPQQQVQAQQPAQPKSRQPQFVGTEQQQIQRERIAESRQKRVDTVNEKNFAPYKAQEQAVNLLAYNLEEARELINSGKTPERVAGALQLKSNQFQNDETQRLNKIFNDIVNNATATQRGPVTGPKLAAQRGAKPSIDLAKDVQLSIIDDFERAHVRPFKEFVSAADSLIAENDYRQPENLWHRAKQRYEEIKPLLDKEYEQKAQQSDLQHNYKALQSGESLGSLPDARKYVGTDKVIVNDGVTLYPHPTGWKPQKPKGR